MPQLDPANFSPQIIWLVIAFLLLYLVMARSALPKVAGVLEERENRITDDLDQAEIMKREAEQLEATYDRSVADARSEAMEILKMARARLQAELDAKQSVADQGLLDQIAEAEDKIAAAKRDAMSEVEAMASEACVSIVVRLTGETASNGDIRAAIRAEISNTESGGNG